MAARDKTFHWFEECDEDPEQSPADKLIDKYAAELERIYTNRTAGDYTWSGVLASFAFELAAVEP